LDPGSRDPTIARAESELADPGDPEIGPPVPASALVELAARGTDALPRRASEASLSTRSLTREIVSLAWPVMGSQVLLGLTGLIDRMMIGRLAEEGSAAIPLAAVGYATQLFFLIHSTLVAVGLACVALMARAIGAGDASRARHVFAASVQISGVLTLVYVGLIFMAGESILQALGAEPSVIRIALPYLNLSLLAALMLSISLMVESALRAARDTRTPMFIAVAVAIVKLSLNGVLIFGLLGMPRLELAGAGLATAISQGVGLILFVTVLARTRPDAPTALKLRDLLRLNPASRDVIRISLPSIGERIVLNLSLLSYFWILSRWYGTIAVATYTVGIAILRFSWIPGTGYSQACTTLVGQALGAMRADLAKQTGQRTVLLAIATAIPLGILCAWLRGPLARLFTDDLTVIAALGPFMLTLAFAQPILQLHFAFAGAHKGAGDMLTPLVAAIVGNWAIRIPIAMLAGGLLELDVVWVWMALIFDHLGRAIYLGVSFLRGRWLAVSGAEAKASASMRPVSPRSRS
jgi:putative MATE family efflux protein